MGTLGGKILGAGTRELDRRRKERAMAALIMLRSTIAKIDSYISKLEDRERHLFNKVVELTSAGDDFRAAIVAGEVSQIRSIARHLTALRYILEGTALKIEDYLAIGEALETIAPSLEALKEIKGVFKGLVPGMELEISVLEARLKELASESGEYTPASTWYSPHASQEARKVLEEAYAVAEKRLRDTFPSMAREGERVETRRRANNRA